MKDYRHSIHLGLVEAAYICLAKDAKGYVRMFIERHGHCCFTTLSHAQAVITQKSYGSCS